jgi:hypothetical protein
LAQAGFYVGDAFMAAYEYGTIKVTKFEAGQFGF